MGGDSRLSSDLLVGLLFLQFLKGFFGEDVEELALLVFKELQHAFLFELFAVDVLHEELVFGEVSALYRFLDIFRKVYVIPKNVIRTDKAVCKDINVQLDGICLAGIDEFDPRFALFRAEYLGVADRLVHVDVVCGCERKQGADEHSGADEYFTHSRNHVYNIASGG